MTLSFCWYISRKAEKLLRKRDSILYRISINTIDLSYIVLYNKDSKINEDQAMTNKQVAKRLAEEVNKINAAFDEGSSKLAKMLEVVMVNELLPLAKCIGRLEDLVTELQTGKE